MELSTAIRQRIINLQDQKNMKLNHLATESGLTQSTLSSFMNGDSTNPRVDTILHICEGFKITLGEFFTDPLFIDAISEKFDRDEEFF